MAYAKGEKPRDQKDRARGGPVLQATASRFIKPEILPPQASRFEATPDSFRTKSRAWKSRITVVSIADALGSPELFLRA